MSQPAEVASVDSASMNFADAPVSENNRFHVMDFIRGIAVFGILAMNIQAFQHSFSSYSNPTIDGHFAGINVATWFITYVFFEQKFYTLFSMLFGAGIMLMAQSCEAKQHAPFKRHYLRNFWLLVFGLAHGFLIWYGDILTTYAVMAMVFYFMWRKSATAQITTGLILITLTGLFMLMAKDHLTEKEAAQMLEMYSPGAEKLQGEIDAYLGGWTENFAARAKSFGFMLANIPFFGLRIGGCMLLGMGLFKLGIIQGQASPSVYKKLLFAGLGLGLPLAASGAWFIHQSGHKDALLVLMGYNQLNYFGSLLVALGYFGLFHLWFRRQGESLFGRRMQAVGRMAFTNYIAQSVICTFVFYGFGLGLFASLTRSQGFVVVFAVWLFQYYFSHWWLQRFYFGPLEWLWRCLTYLRWQAFRR